jgi:hypothetical protein
MLHIVFAMLKSEKNYEADDAGNGGNECANVDYASNCSQEWTHTLVATVKSISQPRQ